MTPLLTPLLYIFHSGRLFAGVIFYCLTGRTIAPAYDSMIRLFCLSRGWTNSLLASVLGRKRRPFELAGILSNLSAAEFDDVIMTLKDKGVAVFPNLLSAAECDRILQQLLPCTGHYVGDTIAEGHRNDTVFNRTDPSATKFTIASKELLAGATLQQLVCDASLLRIAQEYLSAAPIIDIATAWWSTSTSRAPDSEAAQLFHFDMDRPRWLKMFLYLTDVNTDNGPHVFIPGSHTDGGIPAQLLSKGYVRLQDEEVAEHFPRDSWYEAVGPRGTIILEDTRGLHKGKPVLCGDRLIFQVEYTSSLFGAAVTRISYSPKSSPSLHDHVRRLPDVFQAFDPITEGSGTR